MDDEPNGMLNPYGYIQAVIDRHVDVTGMSEYQVTKVPVKFHGRVHGGDAFTYVENDEIGLIVNVCEQTQPIHIHIHGLLIFENYEDCALFLLEDACYKAEHPDAEAPI